MFSSLLSSSLIVSYPRKGARMRLTPGRHTRRQRERPWPPQPLRGASRGCKLRQLSQVERRRCACVRTAWGGPTPLRGGARPPRRPPERWR